MRRQLFGAWFGGQLIGTAGWTAGDGNVSAARIRWVFPDITRRRLAERLAKRAISLGGTCTGEHGVGMLKRRHLGLELSPVAIAAHLAVKHALAQYGIPLDNIAISAEGEATMPRFTGSRTE